VKRDAVIAHVHTLMGAGFCKPMLTQTVLPLTLCLGVETAQQITFSLAGSRPHQRVCWTALGIGLHLILLGLWCWLLTLLPLGVAAPLTGASYLTIALASHFLLKERVSRRGWIGVVGIVIGFALIAGR